MNVVGQSLAGGPAEFHPQDSFLRGLRLEYRRSERSGRHFGLMLLDFGEGLSEGVRRDALVRLTDVASQATRDTDLRGWYQDNATLGIIFTEIGTEGLRAVGNSLIARIQSRAAGTLSPEQSAHLNLELHILPEDGKQTQDGYSVVSLLYPTFAPDAKHRPASFAIKRAMDVTGSLCAIAVLSPVMLGIAAAIKLTSKGPVFFRQPRVGQFGRKFTFLKFRSMKVANDASAHEKYVKDFIAGAADKKGTSKVYKLTNDPRITPIGRFLRRSSLDELPQFFNVLVGDMSLVGPRPPIPYEVEVYDIWHRRRFLSIKPGITGLWQVQGRSRLKFDEMVRLDLRYARSWTIWMDLKILLQTPHAVFMGDGAY
jgi:lipopolysaccharide/colanic/teichoic acid biosynthesis glycosyltransferase